MADLYGKLGGGKSEHERVVGANTYKVRMGLADPRIDLAMEPVDYKAVQGNPRFFNVHRAMLAKDPNHGPMTEAEQMEFFTSDKLPEALVLRENGKDILGIEAIHRETRQWFKALTTGLKLSGESQDELHVTSEGHILEGNTRTAVARTINPDGQEGSFYKVRVICYPKDVRKADILSMLTRRHIAQPRRWESADQCAILQALVDSGMSPKEVSDRHAIPLRKITILLEANKYLNGYQDATKDYRPDNFSIFYKVAGNGTLKSMLYPKEAGEKPAKADDQGLGEYNEDWLPRFYSWVKNDRINGRNDVNNLTNKAVGLLKNKHSHITLPIIERPDSKDENGKDIKGGAGEAMLELMRVTQAKDRHKPGIISLAAAIKEMMKVDAIKSQKLTADKAYVDELLSLQKQLAEVIERFNPGPRLADESTFRPPAKAL